jgi:hypothetical protein
VARRESCDEGAIGGHIAVATAASWRKRSTTR